MSISRRSFAYASAVDVTDLPGLGVPQSVIASLAREFGKTQAGNIVGGLDPDWDDPLPPRLPVGPFAYDWSDADERDRGR